MLALLENRLTSDTFTPSEFVNLIIRESGTAERPVTCHSLSASLRIQFDLLLAIGPYSLYIECGLPPFPSPIPNETKISAPNARARIGPPHPLPRIRRHSGRAIKSKFRLAKTGHWLLLSPLNLADFTPTTRSPQTTMERRQGGEQKYNRCEFKCSPPTES
jgi:hypothetical protein